MKKTIIIGGGVAGLTAGIYGQLAGLDCTIIEKNSFVGGNLTGWERNGHSIDNCMHWLTGTNKKSSLYKLWRTVGVLGDGVKMCHPEDFGSFEVNGRRISLWRDPNRTLSEMLANSPADARESKRFIAAVKAFGRSQLDPSSKALALPHYLHYRKLSLGDLAKRFRHPLLKSMLQDLFTPELSALSLIFAYGAFCVGNADLPYGGSRSAAERMQSRFLALGGTLITDCEAEKIMLLRHRAVGVDLSNNTTLPCDTVICACDPFFAFRKLLSKKHMPKKLSRALDDEKNTPLFSALHAAFSCDALDCLPKNTVIIDIPDFELDGRRLTRIAVKPYTNKILPQPDGKAVLQVMVFLTDSEAKRWVGASRNKESYQRAKDRFAHAMANRLTTRYPELKTSLTPLDVWTPASYERYFHAKDGAFMSFAMKPGRALRYRLPPDIRRLKNVYLATQWQSIPGGLPVAATSAQNTVKALVGRKKKSKADEEYPEIAIDMI